MKPDFEALRAERNAATRKAFTELSEKLGLDPENIHTTVDLNACYCACPDGPCEHDFQGWREFEDGRGGEAVCSRCGQGAMSHSLRVAP